MPVLSVSYREVTHKNTAASGYVPVYEVVPTPNISSAMDSMSVELQELGYVGLLRSGTKGESGNSRIFLIIMPFQSKTTAPRIWIHALLFIATIVSVFIAGWFIADQFHKYQPNQSVWIQAALYTISLMTILTIHELGHMYAARRHGMPTSLPYFIPLPFFLGTMGAIIAQKTPLKNRNVLFDVGLSGPYAGLAVAVMFAILGTLMSPVVPKESVDSELLEREYGLMFGTILFDLIATATLSLFVDIPSNHIVILSPFGLASYFGILVTGINLLPVGQLDGGHGARSLLNAKYHRVITFLVAFFMTLIGFWLMALLVLLLFFRSGHPGPLDDVETLSPTRKVIGILTVGIALVCMPWPPEIYVEMLKIFGLW
ncbi:MAG: site-2 protease family protein [Candidatus Hodarchaeota archaeon]